LRGSRRVAQNRPSRQSPKTDPKNSPAGMMRKDFDVKEIASAPSRKYLGIRPPLHPLLLRCAPCAVLHSTPQSRALPARRIAVPPTQQQAASRGTP
jgi:hypothetical protein